MVLGGTSQRLVQLRGSPPARAGGPHGHHLGPGRGGGLPAHFLSRAEAQRRPLGQRAAGPRRASGRSGLRLHGHDARAHLHHVGLRPHRGRPLGGLRGLQLRGPARSHRGRALQDRCHGQRGPSWRKAHPSQEDGRPGHRRAVARGNRARGPSHRCRRPHGGRAGPLDGRRVRQAALDLLQRVDGGRGPALHPLHVRQHRQAQGSAPHHRGLSGLRGVHPQDRVRLPPRRRLLLRCRRRVDHRAHLHRLRSAGQRGHHGALRVDPALPGCRALLENRRRPGRRHLLHRPDGAPGAGTRRGTSG